ncbi:MAG: hypothetical protein Kow0099_36430 [Candidatus Abyssubacteria bacterium]
MKTFATILIGLVITVLFAVPAIAQDSSCETGIISTVDTPDWPHDIAVSGSYAYISDASSGLQIIDISNPYSPYIVGSVNTPVRAEDVEVLGQYAYVADNTGGLQVIDVSDASAPFIAGAVGTSMAVGLAVSGSYAYVADSNAGLRIIDISNPSSPFIVRTVDTPGGARHVVVEGSYAYVADGTPATGLQIINISNPSTAFIVGSVSTPGVTYGVDIDYPYAYVTQFAPPCGGLVVINVSDPSAPYIEGSVCTSGTQTSDIIVSGDHAYLADYYSGLDIVNIADPSAPYVAQSVPTSGAGTGGVAVSGDYAYLAHRYLGLLVVELCEYAEPTSQTPVIVIPGFMGTYLYHDVNGNGIADPRDDINYTSDELIWIDQQLLTSIPDDYLEVLALDQDGNDLTGTDILVGAIMKENHEIGLEVCLPTLNPITCWPDPICTICYAMHKNLNTYGDLVSRLGNYGYFENSTMFTFPYDWRKRIDGEGGLAESLEDFINERGLSQVDIVAHSMGGLVAREFARDPDNAAKIRKLIFLGTPQNGAPAIYSPFYDGELRHDFLMSLFTENSTMKSLIANWPGVHELLPNSNCYTKFQGAWENTFLFYKGLGEKWAKIPLSEIYRWDDEGNTLPPQFWVPNTGLNQEAKAFHENFDLSEGGEENYLIMGKRDDTLCGYKITAYRDIKPPDFLDYRFNTLESWGDSTVPYQSAFSMANDYYRDIFIVDDGDFKHGDYAMEEDVNQLICMLLLEEDTPSDAELPGERIRRASTHEKSTFAKIRTASPVYLQIVDSLGRINQQVEGEPLVEIPSSSFYVFPHNEVAYLTEPGTYRINILGYEVGHFSLVMDFVEEDVNVVSAAFVNVPVAEGSIGSVDITLAGPSSEFQMDYDGDNSYDEAITSENLPVILSTPVTEVEEGVLYEYPVDAEAAVDGTVTFSLDENPPGMTIDPEGGLITWVAACGPSHVIVRATGGNGNYDTQEFDITVADNNSPEIVAPPDITVECEGASTSVDLGLPTASDTCCDVSVSNDAPDSFPLGNTTVTWTAVDCNGNSSTATQNVTVIDTTPPSLSVSVSPDILWPPNHKMVLVTLTITTNDVCCGSNVTVQLISAQMNEGSTENTYDPLYDLDPDTGYIGKDIQIIDGKIYLRAERAGKSNGRVYTLTYRAADCAGNTSTASATVTVPHDMR